VFFIIFLLFASFDLKNKVFKLKSYDLIKNKIVKNTYIKNIVMHICVKFQVVSLCIMVKDS
jgi:hypothetical protein